MMKCEFWSRTQRKTLEVKQTKADTVLQVADSNNKTNLISSIDLFYHIWEAKNVWHAKKEEVA